MSDLLVHRHDPVCGVEVPLCPSFNRLMVNIAKDVMPEGWDVIEGAPDTLQGLKDYYAEHGRIAVELSGSGGCTMGCPREHYAFRAWHDLVHVLGDHPFNLEGEQGCARDHQAEIIRRLGYTRDSVYMGALVEIEIVGQNAYFLRTGNYPVDPRGFAERWLADRGFEPPAGLQ